MPPKETYVIQKVFLETKPADIPMAFPRQPQLYLELIENKKKIKPELVNKDYQPPRDVVMEGPRGTPTWQAPSYNVSPDPPRRSSSATREEASSVASSPLSSNLSVKERVFQRGTPFSDKYAKPEVASTGASGGADASRNQRLPSLTELEAQQKVQRQREFVDLDRMKHEDDNLKRELLFKMDILRKSYPRATIDRFTIHDKLATIQEYYDSKLRILSLENSVDNYKTYLSFLFMGVEALFGKVFKLDMRGFTEQQMMELHKYEKLLIELGAKSYMPNAKKWPVELRLLFLVIVQTAFFVVGKMILGGAASKILSAVSDMRAGSAMPSARAPSGPNRKMKGPRIHLDDLPDV